MDVNFFDRLQTCTANWRNTFNGIFGLVGKECIGNDEARLESIFKDYVNVGPNLQSDLGLFSENLSQANFEDCHLENSECQLQA